MCCVFQAWVCVCGCVSSRAGICEVFEGHQGPVTGLSCHSALGPVDFSHLFTSSSFDWTVKLWSTKVSWGTRVCVCVYVSVYCACVFI